MKHLSHKKGQIAPFLFFANKNVSCETFLLESQLLMTY